MTTPGTGDSMPEDADTTIGSIISDDPGDVLKAILDHFESEYPGAPATINAITERVTEDYLTWVVSLPATDRPGPRTLEKQLLSFMHAVIRAENAKAQKGDAKIVLPKTLTYWQVAQVLLHLHHIISIAPSAGDTNPEYDLLAMYVPVGPDKGTYTVNENAIRSTARRYNTQLSLADFKETLAILREDSERKHQCAHPDLIAVDNGIVFYGSEDREIAVDGKTFSFRAKDVHPFDPALIFLQKAHVRYVHEPERPVIEHPEDGTVWDVESWIREFYYIEGDDEFNAAHEGMSELLWEIIGAVLRPHVRWGKTAWFYSERGNNGKGTLCSLMRNLVGSGAHTSIPLSDFGKNFALEPLVHANAVIVDENDVGTFIDKAANLKAIVTNDVIQIDRKYRVPMAFQFFGLMVQCLNEFPRMKDKSDSNYRRQLFVPFKKWFGGNERRYIKDDYLQRTEVLEYVLWYAINRAGSQTPGCYYQFSEPAATQIALDEYKEVNDPVRAFWEELRERFVWDLLPFPFLYDLYKAWFVQVSPSGSPVSRQQFVTDLVAIVASDEDWHCPDKSRKIRPGTRMNAPEPLIAEYGLSSWKNPTYQGSDVDKISQPVIQDNYRGIQRQERSTDDTDPDDKES